MKRNRISPKKSIRPSKRFKIDSSSIKDLHQHNTSSDDQFIIRRLVTLQSKMYLNKHIFKVNLGLSDLIWLWLSIYSFSPKRIYLNEFSYYRFQNIMQLLVTSITRDLLNEESCGFFYLIEDSGASVLVKKTTSHHLW